MVKIIQTYVDMKKINEIDRRIDKLKQTIFDSESEIEQIKKQRMNLMTTQFCGKEILYEYTLDHKNEYKKDYMLVQKGFFIRREYLKNILNEYMDTVLNINE
jgi:hypothetical protein